MDGLDIWKWLTDLCLSTPVRGEGPRPGRLHVAPVYGGGHSGRKHTFIVGLDDSRFPGAGLQDPLLLDGERIRVSDDLPTAASRLAGTVQGFARLLARLRGKVTLSYCCRSLEDDRDLFPSPMVLAAFRILSGNPEGDQDDLTRWLPDPASFAPDSLDRCLDLTESWVWWMCAGQEIEDPQAVIARSFPHLGRGFVAREARASDRFTEYDGHVPEAGLDLDPARPGGPVLSASALEKMGSCPLEYFFRYGLGIRPPDEIRVDPRIWLEPAERGATPARGVPKVHEPSARTGSLLPDLVRARGNPLRDPRRGDRSLERPEAGAESDRVRAGDHGIAAGLPDLSSGRRGVLQAEQALLLRGLGGIAARGRGHPPGHARTGAT